MGELVSLQPPSSRTPSDLAISEAFNAWWDLPVAILDTLWDPATCLPDVLPHLARAVGVPLWPARWPLTKQRSFVAAWIAISRQRGREPAYRKMLAAVDAELVQFITPPQILTSRRSRTAEEREAYRRLFPEVRVYAVRDRAERPGVLVPGRPWFGSRRVARASNAPERAGRRAEYRDGDLVRTVAIRVVGATADLVSGHFILALPATGARLTPGKPWFGRNRVARASSAAGRVYRYRDGEARPDLLFPRLEPLEAKPDRVREAHADRPKMVPGRPWFGVRRVARLTDTALHVYDSVRLFDPDRVRSQAAARPGGWIMGRTRLGMDPFRIEILADTSYRRPGRRFGRFFGPARAHDASRIEEVTAALRAASVGRDKVMLRTGLYRPIDTSDGILPDGTFVPGQIVRAL